MCCFVFNPESRSGCERDSYESGWCLLKFSSSFCLKTPRMCPPWFFFWTFWVIQVLVIGRVTFRLYWPDCLDVQFIDDVRNTERLLHQVH